MSVADHGGLLVEGLEWLQARVYDPASRGFLSTDPLEPALGTTGWGNPYAFAGNDPRNASDPWGLAPVSDADLQAYRDSNNGSLRNAASAATTWVKDNWEYIAAGALIVGGVLVMATGVGGPIGAAMIGGALMSGGLSAGMQKHQNGSVDWGQVGVDAAIGGVAGLAGGGAGVAVARSAARSSMNCLGRNVLTGAAAGAADGGVSGGLSYATSGGPLTPSGFAQATLGGAALGGATGGAAGGVFTRVSGSACFVAGTQVLMADGTSKAIEDVAVGDEVRAADPETDEVVSRRVLDTYVTPDVATYAVETSGGTVVSTAEHPFWVDGKGWVPVRALVPGDKLVDADGVRVELLSVTATGETATVHNFNVDGLHTYHVLVGDDWVRVHNKCGDPLPRNSLGQFTTGAGGESAAAAAGRSAHTNYADALGHGWDVNTALPGTRLRPDAWSMDQRVIRELKPDTPSGMAQGRRQLAGYVDHMRAVTGDDSWTGVLDLYKAG